MKKKSIAVIFTDTHLSDETIEVNKLIWKQADDLAQKLNVPLLHGGDAFTSRKAQPLSVLAAFGQILDSLRSIVHIIPGNHDKVDLNSPVSYLEPFKYHPKLRIFSHYGGIPLGETVIHMLPYFKEKGAYVEWLKKMVSDEHLNWNNKNVLLTHIAITGVQNNDSSIVINDVDQNLFEKWDLVIIGHYHNKSEVGDNMLYMGSSYQGNFGEDPYKGFLILYDDLSFEFVQSKFQQYITLELDLNNLSIEEINIFHKDHANSNDFVRFVITGDEEKIKAFDKTKFEKDGIKVILKNDKITAEIERASQGKFVSFNKSNLGDQFKDFCIKEDLAYTKGITYLEKQLL